jgi:hypothetical protein
MKRKYVKDDNGNEYETTDSNYKNIFGFHVFGIDDRVKNVKNITQSFVDELPNNFTGMMIITKKYFIYKMTRNIDE